MAQTPTASLDETFDALTHSHRRYVLYYLRTHSGAATIDTLSAMLANETRRSIRDAWYRHDRTH